MRFSIIFTAFAIFSGQALACNTVMGGCTTEQAVNVAPHMRSDSNKAAAPSAPNTNNAAVNKNIKSANTTTPATKPATKKM